MFPKKSYVGTLKIKMSEKFLQICRLNQPIQIPNKHFSKKKKSTHYKILPIIRLVLVFLLSGKYLKLSQFRKSNPTEPGDYRPISTLPAILKAMEIVLRDQDGCFC
jgi:hypothetical protein